jgi:hypothetical protein
MENKVINIIKSTKDTAILNSSQDLIIRLRNQLAMRIKGYVTPIANENDLWYSCRTYRFL